MSILTVRFYYTTFGKKIKPQRLMPLELCQETAKKMPAKNCDEDLNLQEHISNEISLMRYEIILADYEIFRLTAKCEIKFVPAYATGIFHICEANIS